MRQRGFALFDVLLAVVLMAIAAAGSYTLVKSFRSNSSTQQFIRYSTTITQSALPFLNGNNFSILSVDGAQLSASFLTSIGIPGEDQVSTGGSRCSSDFCYVDSGMYLDGASNASPIGFGATTTQGDLTMGKYFILAVKATNSQVNQVLQSASSLFSIYCASGSVALSNASKCALISKDAASDTINSLYLVFPKSGDTPPNSTITPP